MLSGSIHYSSAHAMDDGARTRSQEMLHGWKEIAAFFDRSARSVQRWEQTLELPIRRISTPDGRQIVYAVRDELDAWLRRMDSKRLGVTPEPKESSPEEPKAPGSDSPADAPNVEAGTVQKHGLGLRLALRTGSRRVVWGSAAAILLVTLGFYAGTRLTAVVPWVQPARLEFTGTELRALANDGQLAWTYAFDEVSSSPLVGKDAVTLADLNGDGELDFIVGVRAGPPHTPHPGTTDTVIALSSHGRLLWSVKPEITLSSSGRKLEGPWHYRATAVSPGPGAARVWIAYSHGFWNPGLVFEVVSNRGLSLRYLQVGWVKALAHWRTLSGDFLAVGGVNNEHEQAALALLEVDGPPAHSPQESMSRFDCADCGAGNPAAYFLFPNSEVSMAEGNPYEFVDTLDGLGEELLATFSDIRMAFIDPASFSARFSLIDSYWAEHRVLEASGRIGHSAENCPERRTPGAVRRWTPKQGWVHLGPKSGNPGPHSPRGGAH
jgi:hypothetical protein